MKGRKKILLLALFAVGNTCVFGLFQDTDK